MFIEKVEVQEFQAFHPGEEARGLVPSIEGEAKNKNLSLPNFSGCSRPLQYLDSDLNPLGLFKCPQRY